MDRDGRTPAGWLGPARPRSAHGDHVARRGRGQAFAVYPNFNVIRRYNPSNFYALVVGMLSDRVA